MKVRKYLILAGLVAGIFTAVCLAPATKLEHTSLLGLGAVMLRRKR